MNENAETLRCGHTLEELSAYVDAGRKPSDPTIDECPECQTALAGLEHLRALVPSFASHDAETVPEPDENWIQNVLATISQDARAGRDIPITTVNEHVTLTQTEGSVKTVIRDAGDTMDGVLTGHCLLDGDVTRPDMPVTVTVSVSITFGTRIPEIAGELRTRIHHALTEHTTLNINTVNLNFDDVHPQPNHNAKQRP